MHTQWTIIIVGSTWVFNNIITALVTSLPAPGKDSSPAYVYWFKVSNAIVGAIRRAESTQLEHSPNWEDAVNLYMQKLAHEAQARADAGKQ